jgi:diguanylate cyclase (GGDEF)-like protein
MAIPLARSRQIEIAVLSIDLDGFDQVCRKLGHEAGNELLRQAAGRLQTGLREHDLLARGDGGGFIVVLQDIAHEAEAGHVAQKLIDALSHPFDLAGLAANAGASIGLAIFPGDGTDAEALLRNAELAMQQARAAGSRMPGFFDPAMQRDFVERRALESDLQRALENSELVLHYQPVLRLPHHSLAEVEALIRWNHPEHGLIGPEIFLPTAEDSGLIKPIGRWVIAEACRQMGDWRMRGHDVPVSVNVSARQLPDGIPPDWLRDTMERSGVPPRNLSFDFPEQLLQADDPVRDRWLEAMERMRIRIGLDDFGAGHASLAQLKEFNIRRIKIGRTLAHAVRSDSRTRALVKSVVDIGRNMMIRVTATDVEDANMLATLHSLGCDYFQGFHLGCPDLQQRIPGFAAKSAVPESIPPLRRSPDPANVLAFV